MTDNEQFTDPAEIRHRIGANGTFSLGNVSGDIRLRGTDTDEVVALARGEGRSDTLPLVVRRAEGSLSIEIDQRGPLPFGLGKRGVRGVEFDIALPRGARVSVDSVSSDIDVTGLLGEQSYRTVSGDLTVMNAGGRLSLTTVSGDVNLAAHEPIEADASSTSGDLEVSGPSLRSMRLRTVSGDVELRGAFDAGAMHNVETVSGDVEIESSTGLTVEVRKGIDLGGGPKQRVVGDGAARLRFRSLSGDLHVAGSSAEKGVKDMPFIPPAPPAPPAAPAPFAQERTAADSLEILRALERGEIDIEEASRRLEGADSVADVQKILALVAEGKLTAEEADEILSAMAAREAGAIGKAAEPVETPARTTHLRIEVTDGGRSVVNLRVPLNVAGWASNFLPGISEQDADRIRGAVSSGTRGTILDITDNDGSRVLITSE